MKYMLFTYRDPVVELDADQRASIPAAVESWCTEMDDRRGLMMNSMTNFSLGDALQIGGVSTSRPRMSLAMTNS